MSNYLSSLGYPFRERPMVFVFSVLIVWAMYLALWAPVLGWIANFCLPRPLYVRLLYENGEAVRYGR